MPATARRKQELVGGYLPYEEQQQQQALAMHEERKPNRYVRLEQLFINVPPFPTPMADEDLEFIRVTTLTPDRRPIADLYEDDPRVSSSARLTTGLCCVVDSVTNKGRKVEALQKLAEKYNSIIFRYELEVTVNYKTSEVKAHTTSFAAEEGFTKTGKRVELPHEDKQILRGLSAGGSKLVIVYEAKVKNKQATLLV